MKSKKLLSLVLVVAMALSGLLIAPAKVSLAKSTSKATMIVGEKIRLYIQNNWGIHQKVASAKTSKKSVSVQISL